MSQVLLVQGNALQIPLRDKSVSCVVTSPPYFGLRSYGIGAAAGELGSETRHDCLGWATGASCDTCWVCHMRQVFAECWRVLRDDGTMFLNLGDSYFSGNGKGRSSNKRRYSGGRVCGTSGTAPANSQGDGSSSNDLCDGCQEALSRRISRTDTLPAHGLVAYEDGPSLGHKAVHDSSPDSLDSAPPLLTEQSNLAKPDLLPGATPTALQPLSVQASTTPESLQQPPAVCSHCDNCGACLAVLRSSLRESSACARKGQNTADKFLQSQTLFHHTMDKMSSYAALPQPPYIETNNTTQVLKSKSLLGMPWRLALALQQDGWILRSDIIWEKPSCMPESVQDRPTRSHEYVFLFAKQARYFWDANAIREAHESPAFYSRQDGNNAYRFHEAGTGDGRRYPERYNNPAGRNARTLWRIPSEPTLPAYRGHYACVDEDTECLTLEGWKHHDALQVGTLAAQFNMQRGTLSWTPIQAVARYSVNNEPLITICNRDLTLSLTPNHRTIIARHHPRMRHWLPLTIIQAEALRPSHGIPIAAPWNDEGGETPMSGDEAELLGWFVAEGFIPKHGWDIQIYQSQSANGPKVERIRRLLHNVGAAWEEATANRTWKGQPSNLTAFRIKGFTAIRLRQWVNGKEKRLPWSILLWHPRLLMRLLDGLIDGDGHRRLGDERFHFVQKDRYTADLVQAIGVRLGFATKLSERSTDTRLVYFTRKQILSLRGTNGRGSQITLEPYTGIVWCPQLPEGTWVARKAGRVFFTGNSFPTALAERCIKAGTSQHGVCGTCGVPWRRVTETTGFTRQRWHPGEDQYHTQANGRHGATSAFTTGDVAQKVTTGWRPTCAHHDAPVVPAIVFDPFVGSGTTLLAARALGRHGIGTDLSWPYLHDIARERLGLAALARWEGAAGVPDTITYTDLPLFA